jgi:hypothetical protein
MTLDFKKILGAIVGLLLLGGIVSLATPPVGYNEGYKPEQPIPYDHSLHAGKYNIPCQYCHSNVETSKHATVPAGSVCLNCHLNIQSVDAQGNPSPWIDKIKKAAQNDTSIEWNKVHLLPDFVHFNHKRHIAKGVKCQTCHGNIQEMEVVYQHSDLSMGWCVNCHRKPEYNAPINCSTCHY